MTPEMLRSQEIVALVKIVTNERVSKLQQEMLETIKPFSEYYERNVTNWINDKLFKVIGKMSVRSRKGISLRDTGMEQDYKVLKNCLETTARLSERISQNTQQIGDD